MSNWVNTSLSLNKYLQIDAANFYFVKRLNYILYLSSKNAISDIKIVIFGDDLISRTNFTSETETDPNFTIPDHLSSFSSFVKMVPFCSSQLCELHRELNCIIGLCQGQLLQF